MAAIPITLLDVVDPVDSSRVAQRAGADVPLASEARQHEWERCVVLQLTMCGAIANRDAIEFARGIVEILLWSAEHARTAAEAQLAVAGEQHAEWRCRACGESVPGNFDVCWQCERARDE